MYLLTENAKIVCQHELGRVNLNNSQNLVTVEGKFLLVEKDPEGRAIAGCPNYGATIKPCTRTLVVQKGYSDLVRIQGKRVCLDTVSGLTDGTPPGTVCYEVRQAGQNLVREVS
ncbi:MAG: hypothetical protein AB4426_02330 [Xenococcaceae cyanobacterium]